MDKSRLYKFPKDILIKIIEETNNVDNFKLNELVKLNQKIKDKIEETKRNILRENLIKINSLSKWKDIINNLHFDRLGSSLIFKYNDYDVRLDKDINNNLKYFIYKGKIKGKIKTLEYC